MRVAPKKVQNGTRKWPHVMPARSNRGFGILEEETEINVGSRREEPPGSSKDTKEANSLDQLLDAVLGTLEPVQRTQNILMGTTHRKIFQRHCMKWSNGFYFFVLPLVINHS